MLIVNELIKRIELAKRIDKEFGKPGSNRGFKASKFIISIISMFHDGATRLQDIRHLMEDRFYQGLLEMDGLPSSDAIGDWLRRQGENEGEIKIQRTNGAIFQETITSGESERREIYSKTISTG